MKNKENIKKLIIDERMRQIEEAKLTELGYELIALKESKKVYPEISSHVDIFTCKIGEKIIIEPSQYNHIKFQLQDAEKIHQGNEEIEAKYPFDIKYNVCTIGKKALHNFEYTDLKIKEELEEQGYERINTTQGYTNCSIAVIDNNSAIVTDKGLYKILQAHGIDTLFINEELDIKLLNGKQYSNKKGFIGGCISRIGKYIIIFGDLDKIDTNKRIREFVLLKGLEIIEFKGLDVVDYGGVVEIDCLQ